MILICRRFLRICSKNSHGVADPLARTDEGSSARACRMVLVSAAVPINASRQPGLPHVQTTLGNEYHARRAFEICVEQILAPSLRSGQIVVLDNLSGSSKSLKRVALACCFCRPTRPICRPSKRRSRNSRRCCAGPEPAHAKRSRRPLQRHGISSRQRMRSGGLRIAAIHLFAQQNRSRSYGHRSKEKRAARSQAHGFHLPGNSGRSRQ
jgi:hypothetical protein